MSVTITSDNQYIVSCSHDKNLILWNLQHERQEVVLHGHTGPVCTVVLSSDNKYIVSGGLDRIVRVWNLQDIILEDFTS